MSCGKAGSNFSDPLTNLVCRLFGRFFNLGCDFAHGSIGPSQILLDGVNAKVEHQQKDDR
jgi:hypothetical protein